MKMKLVGIPLWILKNAIVGETQVLLELPFSETGKRIVVILIIIVAMEGMLGARQTLFSAWCLVICQQFSLRLLNMTPLLSRWVIFQKLKLHMALYPPTNQVMSPFAIGVDQSSGNAAYLRWLSPAMMYAHTYDQFRHAVYQAPFGQQPLSFDYSQNY